MRRLAGAVAALALAGCTGKYVRETTAEVVQPTPERVARGEYLANAMACGGCHTPRAGGDWLQGERTDALLAGGQVLADSGRGRLVVEVPNITPDPETGVGAWSDDQLLRAIRDGVRPDGSFLLPVMPYDAYQHLSDEDARALVAYLRTVPKARSAAPRRPTELGFMAWLMLLKFGVALHPPARDVPAPPADPVARGEYVLQLGNCAGCHSASARGVHRPGDPLYLAGGEKPFDLDGIGQVWATNLTPDPETGLGKLSPAELKALLREGKRRDGKPMAPPMGALCAHFATLSDEDLDALLAYLRSVPPARHATPARQLAPAAARLLGE